MYAPSYQIVSIAEALPNWMRPLAVWLIDRESDKVERELRKLAETVGAFFQAISKECQWDRHRKSMTEALQRQAELLQSTNQLQNGYAQSYPAHLAQYASMSNAYMQASQLPRPCNPWTPWGTVAGFFRGGL